MNLMRQEQLLLPHHFLFPVWMVGCGGIGSPTALLLAKMGCPHMCLMDRDTVEAPNIPNQFFRMEDVGRTKVDALQRTIRTFVDECRVEAHPVFFDGTQAPRGIIISGLDHIDERRKLWEYIRWNVHVPLYIDARLGGESIQVYTLSPVDADQVAFYEESFFDAKDALPLSCTAQSIMYVGFLVAGIIGSQLKKWLRQEPFKQFISMTVSGPGMLTA